MGRNLASKRSRNGPSMPSKDALPGLSEPGSWSESWKRSGSSSRRVIVALFPGAELLDFAGPVQALYEANQCGGAYEVLYAGTAASVITAQGLPISGLAALPAVAADDWVMI